MFASGRLLAVLAALALASHSQLPPAAALQWPFSSSSSATTTTTTTTTTSTSTANSSAAAPAGLVRLRGNRLRRPESCRQELPRRADELPALVATGRVREVYLAADGQAVAIDGQLQPQSATNRALLTVGRVIKGDPQLVNSDIIVSGFNSTSATPCPNYVKPNDTLILLLEREAERRYAIQGGHLLPMNLANLDRVNAIAADEPARRRGPIEDILCEAKYCAYGRCAVVDERAGEVACRCPERCAGPEAPVCGSDNATYASECHLIREGCNRQRPLFVTKESAC